MFYKQLHKKDLFLSICHGTLILIGFLIILIIGYYQPIILIIFMLCGLLLSLIMWNYELRQLKKRSSIDREENL